MEFQFLFGTVKCGEIIFPDEKELPVDPIEIKKKEMYKKWIWKAEVRNVIKVDGKHYLELIWE